MHWKEIIFIFSFLWLHVKTQETLESLIAANKKYSNPSNNDRIEFNDEIKKLEDARSLSVAQQAEVIRNFKNYKDMRNKLKSELRAILEKAKDRPVISTALTSAIRERNDYKSFILEWAEDALIDTNNSTDPNRFSSTTPKSDKPDGIKFSPNLQNQIFIYNPNQTQVNSSDQTKKLLLETIVKTLEKLNEDFFDWF